MRAQDEKRPPEGCPVRLRIAATVFVAVAAVAGCTGENLFTGPSLGGSATGPTVDISTPAADAAVAAGDSIQVTARVVSDNGVTQVTFSGVFGTGTTAFISQVVALPSPQDTTISRFLKQAGTTTGAAKIIVQATDLLGGASSDTVSVTIN